MNELTNFIIADEIGAPILQKGEVTRIIYLSTDSRTIVSGPSTLFFALKTNRSDGHQFIRHAYDKGVRNFVISVPGFSVHKFPEATFILVPDTLEALQNIAILKRKRFKGKVIAVTGSNGKTIVKEWLSELLADEYTVVRSPKSYNSQVGVPLSVWLLDDDADIAIIEAGISEPGEMEKLQRIIQPDIGIFTNIGEAHQSNFDSLEQKIDEKLKLFRGTDVIIYHKDYQGITDAIETLSEHQSLCPITWSMMDETADLFVYFVQKVPEGCGIIAQSGEKQYAISIPFSDDASVENACTCLVALIAIGKDQDHVLNRFSTLQPVAMRLEIKQGKNECIVINDSYNSDLNSLTIALDTLDQQASQGFLEKTLILSDIFYSPKPDEVLYAEVAELIRLRMMDRFIGIGPNISKQAHLFGENATFYESTLKFLNDLPLLEFKQEAILLKGSREFQFDLIATVLQYKAHETVMEIDLSALVHNFNYFKGKLFPDVKIMVMVKAFSYGSGTAEIARVLEFHHADYLAVAIADEGVALRKAGIKMPIVVMNPEEHSFDLMLEHQLEPVIYSLRLLDQFIPAAHRSAVSYFPVHIKLDTGMKRLGFDSENELKIALSKINKGNELFVSSVFSHLAASDEPEEDPFTLSQIQRFDELSQIVQDHSDHLVIRHILNSAGIERFPLNQYEMVRLGIGLYGVSATDQKALQNVSTLKTTISQIRTVKKGETVGYGRKGVATHELQTATLPIGYADGFNRHLGNGVGKVWINGHIVPVIGNICMDMCMVDITGIEAKEGDRVIVFGKELPVTEMADALGTIPYEVFTSVSQRVKRVYFQE
ncbi:MAG TPA: bifunctional UDP-N-acetylmuramoyl-tripeptide:D-alanyl-D-alanine ligase/alanine racemase [Prolixibacteraceae bacterium]|nr:bifunctional UDP-N-acetylmuramoyl-tripeptide:D-alanyl-D-alanine ligase/alanine racemase [Prolixibacteraceae bacterium]